jgi:hypothetical protein
MTHDPSYRRILNRMGYYNYQRGMIVHHEGQKGGWENHHEHSRKFILKALVKYKPEKVTVLGSGWLLDLPFTEMMEMVPKICLVDIIHPPDVISQVRSCENVELLEQDVTGGLIAEVWEKTRKYSFLNRLKSLEKIVIPEYCSENDPGMIISLNILTQLESLPIDFIKRNSRIDEEAYRQFRSEIQKKHVEYLMKHKSILISDYAEVITDKTGVSKTIPTLYTDLPSGSVREEWTWNFDKTGGDLYNSRSQFKVVAMINIVDEER